MKHALLSAALAGAALAALALPARASDCCTAVPPPAAVSAEQAVLAAAKADQAVLAAAKLVDQRGREVTLPDGRPWVLTFFYGNCPDVCPTMVYNVADVAAALPPDVRAKIAFGAISFDPARDTVPRLADYAENFEMQAANRYLLTGEPATLSKVLTTFKFDFKPDRNGAFQHTTLTAVMDGQGRVLHHFYGLRPDIRRIADVARALVTP